MSTTEFTSVHGQLLAAALAGTWRTEPPVCSLASSKLEAITPLLLKSGTAALAWRRLHLEHRPRTFLDQLHSAYKVQKLEAAVHEHNVKTMFQLLREAGIEATLIKGWAVARLYPVQSLRHYGDIDLCVRPNDYQQTVLLSREAKIWVDVHSGFSQPDDNEIFARSFLVQAGEAEIRVPAMEDHLRILCLHLLRHGAWKPLWLVDVAIILETSTQNFDWQRFFGPDPRTADWLTCVLLLAHHLLGARLEGTPIAQDKKLPSWLVQCVLRRWGRWFNSDYRNPALTSLWKHRRQPRKLWDDLYFRFDPIRATVETGGSFNAGPRLPYQLAAFLRRAPEISRHLICISSGSKHR